MSTANTNPVTAGSRRLSRVNLMLAPEDSAWLDQLVGEIQATTGTEVSRSEIVRAAIAGLRELHSLAGTANGSWFPPLTNCRDGSDLAMLAVLGARAATSGQR